MNETEARRKVAVEGVLAGETPVEMAKRVGVRVESVRKWVRAARVGHGLEDRRRKNGRLPTLGDAELDVLEALVTEHPYMKMDELVEELAKRTGKRVGVRALHKAKKRRGIVAARPVQTPPVPRPPQTATRYQEEHRREREGDLYPSSLTDAEWAVLEPIFQRTAVKGGPALLALPGVESHGAHGEQDEADGTLDEHEVDAGDGDEACGAVASGQRADG